MREGREAEGKAGNNSAGPQASSNGAAAEPDLPKNGDAFPGLELRIPFSLASADNLETAFTNYVRGYKGCLDYVWYARVPHALVSLASSTTS
jgi:hypothetical protein